MKVSLVIPAYNEEKNILPCLEHCVSIDGHFQEIIIVDNNSTDDTAHIVKEFINKSSNNLNIKLISENKKGVMHARNRGFLESTGEIIAFVDADTKMPKNWLKSLEQEFVNNQKIVCVSGPMEYEGFSTFQKILCDIYLYTIAMPVYFLVGYMGIYGNLAIKRNILQKIGGVNTQIDFYGDDTDITRRASKFGKVKFTPKMSILASGRRFSGQGIWNTTATYFLNFLSQVFMHKSLTKTHKDYR